MKGSSYNKNSNNAHESNVHNSGSCHTELQQQYKQVGDKTCFTNKMVPKCPKGCKSGAKQELSYEANCIATQVPVVEAYKRQIQQNRRVNALSHQKQHIKIDVPSFCIAA